MNIKINNYIKNVYISKHTEENVYIVVGKAIVKINKQTQKAFITIPGLSRRETVKYINLVMSFVNKYKSKTLPSKLPVICFNSDNPAFKIAIDSKPSNKSTVSGFAKWMTDLKTLIPVYHRKGDLANELWYYRHSLLEKDSDIYNLIIDYLPYCCQCTYRSDCHEACSNREESCIEEIKIKGVDING